MRNGVTTLVGNRRMAKWKTTKDEGIKFISENVFLILFTFFYNFKKKRETRMKTLDEDCVNQRDSKQAPLKVRVIHWMGSAKKSVEKYCSFFIRLDLILEHRLFFDQIKMVKHFCTFISPFFRPFFKVFFSIFLSSQELFF